jgi:hypothetical protein
MTSEVVEGRREPLDPRNIVDFQRQQEDLTKIVEEKRPQRLVAVTGGSGYGKSTLLVKLKFYCNWTLKIPAARVPVDELGDDHRPYTFAKAIHHQLKMKPKVKPYFREFERLNSARRRRDPTPFLTTGPGVDPADPLSLALSDVTDPVEDRPVPPSPVAWSTELEELAEERCLDALLAALDAATQTVPIAIMIDAFELCSDQLREWIEEQLITGCCLSTEQWVNLVVVVAGPDVPYDPGSEQVLPVDLPGTFERDDDIAEFLRKQGVDHPDAHDIEEARSVLEEGHGFLPLIGGAYKARSKHTNGGS